MGAPPPTETPPSAPGRKAGPPARGERRALKYTVGIDEHVRVTNVAKRLGLYNADIVQLLLESFTEQEMLERVQARRAARAAL